MTRRGRRLGFLGGLLVAALAVAVPAFAAFSPTLDAGTQVSESLVGEVGGTTNIAYKQGASDDPPAKITFYVPAGYAALLAQPDGEEIGTVTGTAVAADLGGATLQLAGKINVAVAATTVTSGGVTLPLSTIATQCTGTPTHSAYWVINLSASGQTLQVPAFVDDIALTSPLSAMANNTIQICLPPPDVPAGTPGRAALGAKLVSANLSITEVFSTAPGWYLWHVVATPYNPGRGTANAAGTVTTQSYDRTPQNVTLAVRQAGGGLRVTASGKVTSGNKGVGGAAVSIQNGKNSLAKATTKANGSYSVTLTVPRAKTLLNAAASAPTSTAPCQPGWFGPSVQCTSAQYASFVAVSTAVRSP